MFKNLTETQRTSLIENNRNIRIKNASELVLTLLFHVSYSSNLMLKNQKPTMSQRNCWSSFHRRRLRKHLTPRDLPRPSTLHPETDARHLAKRWLRSRRISLCATKMPIILVSLKWLSLTPLRINAPLLVQHGKSHIERGDLKNFLITFQATMLK